VDAWPRAGTIAVLAVFLVLLGFGCSGNDAPSARDRADARRYVDAAEEFTHAASADARDADLRIAGTFSECSLIRLSVPEVPPVSELAAISLVGYYRAVLPSYRRFVRRLSSIRAEDATLRKAAQAARAIEAGYDELRSARPDYCRTLRAWQALGWRKGFSVLRAIGVSERSFAPNGTSRTLGVQQAERVSQPRGIVSANSASPSPTSSPSYSRPTRSSPPEAATPPSCASATGEPAPNWTTAVASKGYVCNRFA
jgi:hypothetical protein